MLAVMQAERQAVQGVGQAGVQPQLAVTCLQPGESPLQQVHRPGHGPEVDPLRGGAALNVGHVGVEGLKEVVPGLLPVSAGQHPRMDDLRQRGAVRGAPHVVVDVAGDQFRVVAVPEPADDLPQLFGGEQVEEHENVRLLGEPVSVGGIALGLQNAVEAGNVAVPGPVIPPVELFEALISFELAQYSLVMPAEAHLSADVLPALDFLSGNVQEVQQLAAPAVGQHAHAFEGVLEHPDNHYVGVGVVVQARLVPPGIAVVVLVGPHYPAYVESVTCSVVGRQARPELGDLEDDFRAVLVEKIQVAGRLVVLPGVVGDGGVGMALQMRMVWQPPSRLWVQVHLLGFLAPVGPALPREHGAPAADVARRLPGLGKPPPTVEQQCSRQFGHPQAEVGIDEHGVPEDVAAVGLAVQATRRDADVEVDAVRGQRLQQVEQVQVQNQVRPFTPRESKIASLPQVVPGKDVARERVGEVGGASYLLPRLDSRFGDGAVLRGVEGNDLLDGVAASLVQIELDVLADVAVLGDQVAFDLEWFVVEQDTLPGGEGDPDVRLRRLAVHRDDVVVDLLAGRHHEMTVGKTCVPAYPGIGDPAVDARPDDQSARPILRYHGAVQHGEVRVGHGHGPALRHRRPASLGVLDAEPPGQYAAADVEFLDVVADLGRLRLNPLAVDRAERQGLPVGQVDDALVFDMASRYVVPEPIEDAGNIGTRAVHVIGNRFRGGAPGHEAAVSEGAQCLPQTLGTRVEAVVPKQPATHPDVPSPPFTPTATSARSATTMSAPASASRSLFPPLSTPITSPNSPWRAAATPATASSTTAVRAGVTESRRAASRNTAGLGLPGIPRSAAVCPSTDTGNKSAIPAPSSTAARLREALMTAVATPAPCSVCTRATVDGYVRTPSAIASRK